jgi:hypothetical protein
VRQLTDAARLQRFMRSLGEAARDYLRVYFTGGASAVIIGWRGTTVDVDLKMVPEQDAVLRAIPKLKEDLEINVELASPGDFIPELPGWESRSPFVRTDGRASFYHYDFYAQCLAKIERSHARDLNDIHEMMARGLVQPERLLEFFDQIEPQLYRYPAIDARSFRRAVEEIARAAPKT